MVSLTIGQLAHKCGVKIPTLRFYERRGLLHAPRRTAARYRLYSDASVQRVHFIKRAQSFGFTLNEIRHLLDLLDGHHASSEVCDLANAKIQQLEQRVRELLEFKENLRSSIGRCSQKGPAESCAIIKRIQA